MSQWVVPEEKNDASLIPDDDDVGEDSLETLNLPTLKDPPPPHQTIYTRVWEISLVLRAVIVILCSCTAYIVKAGYQNEMNMVMCMILAWLVVEFIVHIICRYIIIVVQDEKDD